MISGVKADLIDPLAIAVECIEHWGIAIGLYAPADHFGRTGARAQRGQPLVVLTATGMGHCIDERTVAGKQVDILKGWSLIDNLMRIKSDDGTGAGH